MNPDTTPTPRTDRAIAATYKDIWDRYASFRVLCERLERELTEKTNEVERLREEIEFWKAKSYEAEEQEGKFEYEVERLRELLNRAIGCTKNALFFARTYDNKNQWNEIDKLWDEVRELEKAALAPAPEEPKK